ncbi:MAG TPA: hypothetical protein VF162_18470 [Streptosporangiaceae bacterium]
MDRAREPGNAAERDLLLGWLAFHRDALAAKCEGLTFRATGSGPCSAV